MKIFISGIMLKTQTKKINTLSDYDSYYLATSILKIINYHYCLNSAFLQISSFEISQGQTWQ